MTKTFAQILSMVCMSGSLELEKDHDPALDIPQKRSFFIQPTLKSKNDFSGKSPFMLISAPGATGKSALGYNLSIEKNGIYWDLSKANIGDNYFIGTLTKSFGVHQLTNVLDLIRNGNITFVFDAFDEAELTSGWDRISSLLKEIIRFVNNEHNASFILLARYETAQYLSLILDDLIGENHYNSYEIEYFSKSTAKEFLYKYLVDKDNKYIQLHDKIDQISTIIFDGIDRAMASKAKAGYKTGFYGYAPVLLAIATLFRQYSSLQELENEYTPESKYNEITATIIENILDREKNKVIDAFKTRLEQQGLPSDQIQILYSSNEQLSRLIKYISEKKISLDDYYTGSIDKRIVKEYQKVVQEFLPQHPFIINVNEFSSPAFKDYAYALILSTKIHGYDEINIDLDFYSSITPLFWQYYILCRGSDTIDGGHVGIICESFVSGKMHGEDVITAIYDTADGTELSTMIQFDDNKDSQFTKLKIGSDSGNEVFFPYHLKNTFITTNKELVLGDSENDFTIINTTVNVDQLRFNCKKVIIRCDDIDKPVTLVAVQKAEYKPILKVEKIGGGELIIYWPEGRRYPWAEHYKEVEAMEEQNIDNLLLSLRQILKWFRKDKRDSIARYADFIENVAVSTNKLNRKMLDYLLEKNVLWKDGGLYKLSHKIAEKKGINFTSMKNVESNDRLKEFLSELN